MLKDINWKEIALYGVVIFVFCSLAIYVNDYLKNKKSATAIKTTATPTGTVATTTATPATA